MSETTTRVTHPFYVTEALEKTIRTACPSYLGVRNRVFCENSTDTKKSKFECADSMYYYAGPGEVSTFMTCAKRNAFPIDEFRRLDGTWNPDSADRLSTKEKNEVLICTFDTYKKGSDLVDAFEGCMSKHA